MTQRVRTGYRKHPRATWAGALAVFIAAALALVLPALAIDTSPSCPAGATCIPPASDEGITPSLVNIGGSNFNCQTHAGEPAAIRQFQISSPVAGNSYTDPATGVRFEIKPPTGTAQDGTTTDPKTWFSFSVTGSSAVVYDVGVKGGTKTEWYDYKNNTPAHAAFPVGGVYSDQNLHSTPDSKYTPTSPTFFTASITTFCYETLTVTPSCTTPFNGHGFGGTGGTVQYSAQLVAKNGQCKTDKVIMYSYTPGIDHVFATLNPVAGGATGSAYEVVEHIHWTGITTDGQNPVTLWYDDTSPYTGDDKRDLKLCNSDPRTSDFVLGGSAPHTGLLPTGETSCMLESTDSAGTGPDARTYDAWIFSNIDGGRGY